MFVNKPPMGWNSWNTFAHEINDALIRSVADKMVEDGYLDAGYEYIVIDDCWSEHQRDENNRLVPDHEKFPYGIKALADYVHSKGLKFGIYSCCGNYTCAGYPASFEYEFIDAETFAEWGVDYLKYDYCYKPASENGAKLYRRMGLALANCGRDIVFSACSWGADETHRWIKSTGADLWRSTGDIVDSFESVKAIYNMQKGIYEYNGHGCFNDMDMLIVGMFDKGNVKQGGCTVEEYKTHFSIWSFFGSPLMIGSDIRTQTAETKAILQNKAVIAINQDVAYREPYLLMSCGENADVWVRHMENGDIVFGIFNMTDENKGFPISFTDLGLNRSTGVRLRLFDVWEMQSLGEHRDIFVTGLAPHSAKLIRARLIRD
ncbi:MAG: glycoside hydrolase family 27 protein [Clostridia bacterium]|jgi:alpha-galactosidase|nr:glycoside hydrolase family 27 protein [Clostridia bacterium]MBO7398794.1 glycoside hydrolase family 27 protein [Clostridia bacterium]MBO7503120.1 glycoside hydrolase family 27 protein [Clostridia bacterium]MBP5665207.1 glycoside hydrolase family 27 protein [Clostridia bacterium]MBP5767069.1 glycoside hydrolase family 27 protein [Clostridia bacterium]